MFEVYIFLMGLALLIWAAISLFAFDLLINAGVIYPADYAEYRISEVSEQIKTANEVTDDLIPEVCRYVVFSEDGKVLSGDLDEKDVETAWKVLSNNNYSDGKFYKIIIRPDEYVVLQYRLKPQYKSMWMNEHLPNPENLLTIFIIICCLGIMQIFAKKFGSGIRKKMTPMREALEQIGDRNLDFKVNYSGVREIDECLVALDDMRYALKTSLQKQWETEQEKSRQMSALAHDIKTPLTVVRGNSELLLETELTDGLTKIETTFDGDTVWLSIDQMAELFQRDKSTISRHIKNIFTEGELKREAVVANFATTAADGKAYQVDYYNLDVIISVGYRVKSQRGVQFRIWATGILKEYMRKGFALDDERLKNLGGGGYFKELLERIRDIRSVFQESPK